MKEDQNDSSSWGAKKESAVKRPAIGATILPCVRCGGLLRFPLMVVLRRLGPNVRALPWPLALLLGVQIALWIHHPMPLGSSDVAAYARKAFEISEGSFFEHPKNHVFNHRWGLLLPLAGIYRVLGVSEATTFILPLAAGMGLTISVWFVLRKNAYGAALGASIAAFTPLSVQHLRSLFPDLILTSLCAGAVALLSLRHEVKRPHVLACFTAFVVVWAFSVKLTAYYIIPSLVAACCFDLWRGGWSRVRSFQVPLIVYGLLGTALLLFAAEQIWQDPLARLEAVNSHKHTWRVRPGQEAALHARLFVEPWKILFQTFGFPLLLSVCALVVSWRRHALWVIFFVVSLLSVVFGSAALNHYQPLPLFPRMFLPLLPSVAVLAGSLVPQVQGCWKKDLRWGLLCGGLALTLLSESWFKLEDARQGVDAPREAMKIVREQIRERGIKSPLLLSGGKRSVGTLPYYFGWRKDEIDIRFIERMKASDLAHYDAVYIYMDIERARYNARHYGSPNYSKILQPKTQALYRTRGVYLYGIDAKTLKVKLEEIGRARAKKRRARKKRLAL